MSSGLTLGFARANLPTSALAAQKAATAATAALEINAATAWLLSHGKWVGTKAEAVFPVYDESQVTLPRGMLAILAGALRRDGSHCHCKVPVMNEWYSWLPGGPGLVSNAPCDVSGLISQGDGFVTFRNLPSAGTIKIYSSNIEETEGTINIRGYSSGEKVFTNTGEAGTRIEGEDVEQPTSANTSVSTTTTFDAGNSLYGIVKPMTNGEIRFFHVAADSTETLIGRYEPGEQIPNYRRYWVPARWITDAQVVALCKRKHVNVAVDNDPIIPGNLNALEMALMAKNFQRKSEMDRASQYIGMAIDELNSELEQFNAPQSNSVMQIDPFCSMSDVPNLV